MTLEKTATYTILLLSFILLSCYQTERKYYGNEVVNKIKFYKKNQKYTFLSYKLPSLSKRRESTFAEQELTYHFKKNSFLQDRTTFALVAPSTSNVGVLYKIEHNQPIQIDSLSTSGKEFILLNLDPILEGEYLIKTWGCRYHKAISILIE